MYTGAVLLSGRQVSSYLKDLDAYSKLGVVMSCLNPLVELALSL